MHTDNQSYLAIVNAPETLLRSSFINSGSASGCFPKWLKPVDLLFSRCLPDRYQRRTSDHLEAVSHDRFTLITRCWRRWAAENVQRLTYERLKIGEKNSSLHKKTSRGNHLSSMQIIELGLRCCAMKNPEQKAKQLRFSFELKKCLTTERRMRIADKHNSPLRYRYATHWNCHKNGS